MLSLNFKDCHTKIRHVDAHATLNDGVVVQVMGELSNNMQPVRRFMQTFVLAPEVGVLGCQDLLAPLLSSVCLRAAVSRVRLGRLLASKFSYVLKSPLGITLLLCDCTLTLDIEISYKYPDFGLLG